MKVTYRYSEISMPYAKTKTFGSLPSALRTAAKDYSSGRSILELVTNGRSYSEPEILKLCVQYGYLNTK